VSEGRRGERHDQCSQSERQRGGSARVCGDRFGRTSNKRYRSKKSDPSCQQAKKREQRLLVPDPISRGRLIDETQFSHQRKRRSGQEGDTWSFVRVVVAFEEGLVDGVVMPAVNPNRAVEDERLGEARREVSCALM
jgi:hypothetical protein